jgi:CRP/FNR family cyclic AMP-dependent transcriptional regulator
MNVVTTLPASPHSHEVIDQEPSADIFGLLEECCGDRGTLLKVRRSMAICTQGARLSCLYLIKQGEVFLTRLSPDGRETLISILGPGEFFGESALLSGTSVTFSASARRQSTLLQLPARKFKRMLEDPQVCYTLLEAIARRCDDAWTQMEVLGCSHVRDKVRSGLLWLSGRIGVETREGVRIDLNQTQLARMVGCARETLSREVSELRRLHTVDIRRSNGRKSLFVLDLEGLNQYA